MNKYFICDNCGLKFKKALTDEQAEEQFKKEFPNIKRNKGDALVCDDCYKKFMEWLKNE